MKNESSWRAVRWRETVIGRELRRRHVLWLHGFLIGALILIVTLGLSIMLRLAGVDSLAIRYLLALGGGYVCYLILLRLWAGWLLDEKGDSGDLPGPDAPGGSSGGSEPTPPIHSGGGGDFAGGGASASFDGPAPTEGIADLAGGALEVASAADEGAVVVIPVVAIFLIGLAVVFGAGSLLMLYFGWDVLLAVAVELAFSFAGARTALRVAREGWLSVAIGLTWKPLAGAALCAVLLGGLVDVFIPAAQTLPQAIKALHAQH